MTFPTSALWRGRLAALTVFTALVSALPAHAVPYFARKYETSCNTCHVAQPKLNDFGIAFRNNGYEWPGGEQEMTKQKPVVLSAEANKEAFPDAVWPSWFPSSIPLSILLSQSVTISDKQFPRWVSPAGLGSGLGLVAAGAVAPGISVHAFLGIFGTAASPSANVSVSLAYARFRLIGEKLAVRAGKLTPDLFTFPSQTIGGGYWVYSRKVGKTPWSLGGKQGLEFQSILGHGRVRAVAGAAGSSGELGDNWDGWVHVATKIGGIRFDGVEDGQEEASSPADAMHPWRDNSLQLGASVYNGQSHFTATPTSKKTLNDNFIHYGVDLDAWWGDANLMAAAVIGRHSQLFPGASPTWIHTLDAELDYVVYPWFIPSVLWEWSDDAQSLPYSVNQPKWHVVGSANFLIVSNVRAYAQVDVGPYSDTPAGPTSFNFLSGNLGVSLGF